MRWAGAIVLLGLAAVAASAPLLRNATPAEQLINAAFAGNEAYSRLAEMTDTFGPRISGSAALEDSIDWVVAKMQRDGFHNVYTEPVNVPLWVRNEEYAYITTPRRADIAMLGLGASIGTNGSEITAEVLVVSSFDELEERSAEARGKIVLFNAPFVSYGASVVYRFESAWRAAEHGAVASLIVRPST